MKLPLVVGGVVVDPPVVLAPMAGVTNLAFRRLCREQGAGLFVSEMVTARALVEDDPKSRRLMTFGHEERPRSLQLYSTDPGVMARAVTRIREQDLADHVDLNFGCPARKVTRKGGGAALPWKSDLFRQVVSSAVDAARGRFPVSVKMRMGIDSQHLTYLEAGRVAAESGVAWVALHARTAEQYYGGRADWEAIARLKELLAPTGTPVLGNGDIWSAADALAVMEQTGCDGVVIGRGCLGRPWLFGQLSDAFAGLPVRPDPDLAEVVAMYRRHAELLMAYFGEHVGSREIRKHHAWYFKGFRVSGGIRQGLGMVESLADVDRMIAGIDTDQSARLASGRRGRSSGARRVILPEGWLESRTA
ncbi:MAG: tRNA dihydrouridine synthase DusB [Candidatus Nanopelagicales bacterium]|nr:tRNA dihydrouridine synthase DusB [Candidatus Nanopelagicales bacterium]MDZ4250694.1 tRNA dihydrouridine synthase DusB [Candidatus Nanopelagicales bacterium]